MSTKIYDEFLETTGDNKEFIEKINDELLRNDFDREVSEAKSGHVVSYHSKKSKKTIATFVCRKTGIKIRIYPTHLADYVTFLDKLPPSMKKEIIKASVCKRLINPATCNQKCVMGYDFVMDNERYKKCRYMAFMHQIMKSNYPFIEEFLSKEIKLFK